MKLIKLSDTHYIVVDDSNITQACYIYKTHKNIHGRGIFYLSSDIDFEAFNKEASDVNVITHSTQPLIPNTKGITAANHSEYLWGDIKPLSLSEVEELIYGYSVDEMAIDSADKNSRIASDHWMGVRTGYHLGFKAHQELVKDKLFTDEIFDTAIQVIGDDKVMTIREFIQSALPKTEWNCTFNEEGKIVIIQN